MKTSHFLMLIALCMLALTGCSNDDIQSVDTTPEISASRSLLLQGIVRN